jgi:hypothetical protein
LGGVFETGGDPPGGPPAYYDDRFDGFNHFYCWARTPKENDRP